MLAMGPIAGIGFLFLAAIMGLTSVGCFAVTRWGWRLAVALIGMNAMADGARALTGELVEGLTGLVIAGGLLWVLLRPRIRQLFGG